MKLYMRILSVILTVSILLSMAVVPVQAADTRVTGSISVTMRIDYAQKLSLLQQRSIQMELKSGGKSLGSICLTDTDAAQLGDYPAQVIMRDADGGELIGGEWPAFLDLTVKNLPEGAYTLSFTGEGYKPFSVDVTLKDYSQHVILGTGDSTFTLGDLTGDKKVDEADRDALAEKLGSTDEAATAVFDLNGDSKIDIIDLAYVTRSAGIAARGALGTAEVLPTYLINPIDEERLMSDFADTDSFVTEGSLADLFADNGKSVSVTSSSDTVEIPITLRKEDIVEEIVITSPEGAGAVQKGRVEVEYEDGVTEEIFFDKTPPEGVYAIGETADKSVITVELGRRVAVKKVLISVAKTAEGYVTVESIQFLHEIVPETPTSANNAVRNLTAQAGDKKVSLKWDTLPNVTGYKIEYYLTEQPAKQNQLRVDTNSAEVSGLDNLKEYTFAVTPTADSWVGKAAYVTATPFPESVPAAPDMVTLTEGDGMLDVSWKTSKNATYYKVFYAKDGTDSEYQQAGGTLLETNTTITNLENGTTYNVYVVSGNTAGESGPSRIYQGTPSEVKYSRPEGIPTEGVIGYEAIEKVWLAAGYNVSPTSYPANKPFKEANMADGDFSTHWTSHSYGDGNWWDSKEVLCTFKTPQDISSVIWVPRLDGQYANNLRVYTVSVWLEGDDLNAPGRLAAPDPQRGSASDVKTWANVLNNPSVTKFAVLPIEPQKNVVKMSITIEQQAYTAVSLSELMFMQYDPDKCLPDNIEALFADNLHTTLADGVTQADITALRARLNSNEKNYYLNTTTLADELTLAEELLSGQSKGVMIDGIRSRSNSDDSAKYGQSGSELQAIGAAAKANQEITVFAEGIPDGETVTVYAAQYNAEVSAWIAEMGTLHNGRNILSVPKIGSQNTDRGGSLYLSYSGPGAEHIKLHIRQAVDIPMLELDDWYSMTEQQRRDVIEAYIDELTAYPAKAGVNTKNQQTNCLNVTEISMPSVLLSIPAQSVLTGIGYGAAGKSDMVGTLYHNVEAWEDIMHICKITQGIDNTYERSDMTSRQNIRCMQMFTGAFMYAAGNHVGIGYSSCAGMVCGKTIRMLDSGAGANDLFGWGIAHEIGHNMDKLGQAEITNNIYSLMVQTYDGNENALTSRLEAEGRYSDIFTKTAQGYPGASGNVFIQLGMYWQLHLAYDGKDSTEFYNAFFKAWKAGTYTAGANSYDDKVALTAAGVAGRDLTEFFTRWGMRLSDSTLAKLKTYDKESRAIWYLSDDSRRARINGAAAAEGTLSALAKADEGTYNSVTIKIDASGIEGSVQGYEIIRNGVAIGFTADGSYTDIIGSGNHRTYEYEVKAYDILGNRIGEAVNAGEIRVAYDMTVDPDAYTVSRDADTVTITLADETAVSGIKLTGENRPSEGEYTVTVTSSNGTSVAKQGDFSSNQAVDDKDSFLAYFNKPGADSNDTRIWTYDAKTVTITGISQNVNDDQILLVSYVGDDVSFLEGGFAGILDKDYVYGSDADDVIPAGTLIIVGNYRGDPVYNGVKIRGRYTSTSINAAGEPVTTTEERDMDGYTLMFAEVPQDGAVSDISDGIFIFVPDVQKEAELQGASRCDGANLLPTQIRAEIFRTDDPSDASSMRTTAETLWVFSPGGDNLPVIVLEGSAS